MVSAIGKWLDGFQVTNTSALQQVTAQHNLKKFAPALPKDTSKEILARTFYDAFYDNPHMITEAAKAFDPTFNTSAIPTLKTVCFVKLPQAFANAIAHPKKNLKKIPILIAGTLVFVYTLNAIWNRALRGIVYPLDKRATAIVLSHAPQRIVSLVQTVFAIRNWRLTHFKTYHTALWVLKNPLTRPLAYKIQRFFFWLGPFDNLVKSTAIWTIIGAAFHGLTKLDNWNFSLKRVFDKIFVDRFDNIEENLDNVEKASFTWDNWSFNPRPKLVEGLRDNALHSDPEFSTYLKKSWQIWLDQVQNKQTPIRVT